MRSHEQIIVDGGGPTKVGSLIGIDPNTVKQWKRNDSIPGGHFQAFVDAGLATAEELSRAADRRTKSGEGQQAAA